jgi:hypothetical protein
MENNLEVAKVMIQAGIQAAAKIAEMTGVEMESSDAAETSESRTLH